MTLCATCNHWPEGTACALTGCPGRKISETNPLAAGAAAQSSAAAPGPTAAPAIWPYAYRSLAAVDAADHSATIDDASARLLDGDGTPRSDLTFHANLNTPGERRNHA